MTEKKLIYDLIREILAGNNNYKIFNELDNQLYNMVREWMKDKGQFDEALIFDVKQTAFMSLYQSLSNNNFWKEKQPVNEDNNKAMIAYVYTIIKSSFRTSMKDITTDELKNLRPAVISCIKSLKDENIIVAQKINNEDYYSLNNNGENKKPYDGYDEIRAFFVLRKPGKDSLGKISKNSVYEALVQIFNNLENYYLSLSDIIEILLTNSDVNLYTMSYLVNVPEFTDDRDNTINEEKLSVLDSSIEKLTNLDELIEQMNNKLRYYIDKKKKLDIYKISFYLYYQAGFTLQEISDYLYQKMDVKLSLQTIKNYLGDFINILNLQKDFTSEESEVIQLLEEFMKYIEKEYNLSE
jgi:hypothetical protein